MILEHFQQNTLRSVNMTTKHFMLKRLEDLLSKHDWFYKFSDDPTYYRRGVISNTNINQTIQACKQMGYEEDVQRLYKKYSKQYEQSTKGKY